MRKKEEILNVIFINIPITLVLCMFAQLLTIWEGNAGGFSVSQFLLNIPIAYIAATLIGLGIPSVRWGVKFAESRGARSGGLAYALLMNIVVNTVYTLLLSIIMTFVNVFLIAHGPVFAVLAGIIINFIPLWIVCYIVSFFFAPLCRKLAAALS